MAFDGEYLNGEKNGEGKEYFFNGNLVFEGIFLNGYRFNGKVKEYNGDGEIIFEGEYLNGIKKGEEKHYTENDVI